MYRWRREVIPRNPDNQIQIDVNCDFVNLDTGETIIKGDDVGVNDNDRILLMSTERIMNAAAHSASSGFDCTFVVAPGPNYSQVFIMFMLVGRVYWAPTFYAILPNKEESTYRRLYVLIDQAMSQAPDIDVPGEHLQFNENLRVMADFEIGERTPWHEMHLSLIHI